MSVMFLKVIDKFVKVLLIFEISVISQICAMRSTTCGGLENKIKSYKDEIANLKIALEEYELAMGKTKDVSDECNQSLTCSSCLWEKINVECGWCILQNRCSLSQNCLENNSSSSFWISRNDKCPKIRAVRPHYILASKPVELEVFIPHLSDYNGTFICSFEISGRILVTKGKKFDYGITCPSPYTDKLPAIPLGTDHMAVTLSLRTPNGPNFASTSNITIYDCNRYHTCSECSASVFPCSWCIVGNKCTHDVNENCRNDVIVFSQSVTRPTMRQGPDYCPKISPYTEAEDEILIPSRSKKRIFVKLENIVTFHVTAKFTCKVRGFPEVTGQLLGETVYCDVINLRVLGRQPVYNLSLSIFWNGEAKLDNSRNLHVLVYDCGRMGTSCGECTDLPEKYNCGWCEEDKSCAIRENCADPVPMADRRTCKEPQITSIYPIVGTLNGKTNLTIEGINLAKEFQDIDSIKLIDENGELSHCTPYENLHVRYSRIVCLIDTSQILAGDNETLKGFVEVKFSNSSIAISEVPYYFVDPFITGFEPVKGMMSGGIILNISGFYLDAGNEVEVYIGDLPCRVISRDRSSIKCITSPVSTDQPVPKSSAVRVIFDGEERMSSGYFFYVEDPSIHSVKGEHGSDSPVGTPSGRNMVFVDGANLDYAPNPYIYVVVDDVEYPGICKVISETRMECFTPRIPAESLNFCDKEGSLSLKYGFKMGNSLSLGRLGNVKDAQSPAFGNYKIFPDPYLMPFKEKIKIKYFKSDYLTIEGKYLDTVFSGNDFTVTVGEDECVMISLAHTQLTCKLPEMEPEGYDENRLPEVQVKIRSSFQYFIGFLRYEKG